MTLIVGAKPCNSGELTRIEVYLTSNMLGCWVWVYSAWSGDQQGRIPGRVAQQLARLPHIATFNTIKERPESGLIRETLNEERIRWFRGMKAPRESEGGCSGKN
jgi:hypothetical protein